MKYVELSQNKRAKICDCHYDLIKDFKWCVMGGKWGNYAVRAQRIGGKRKTVLMHRVIANLEDGVEVDHKNRDGLDNRCSNLRAATSSQNKMNRGLQSNNTSGYRGIIWDSINKKWKVNIKVRGVVHWLGRYNDLNKAIEIRQEAEAKYFGEFV
jgi:hypothetical protein